MWKRYWVLLLVLGCTSENEDKVIPDTGPSVDGGASSDASPNEADAIVLTGPPGDRDDDGIQDDGDNCPTKANHGQSDEDEDGVGDACDNCPEQANPDQADENNNGQGDLCDTTDSDGDGILDSVDICPEDADRDQRDQDDDGVGDACDNCPREPNFSQADEDGDGIGDACEIEGDADADGVPDADDNCPNAPNQRQRDRDEDGVGDPCDNCPRAANFSQTDSDGDGTGDACEEPDPDPPAAGALQVRLSWQGESTDLDLHLLHPEGKWYHREFDVYYRNKSPDWALPGLIADTLLPGDELIRAAHLPRGVYVIGVLFYQSGQLPPVNEATARLEIECGERSLTLGPMILDTPMKIGNIRQPGQFWQAARVRMPDCEIIPVPEGQRLALAECTQASDACLTCAGCIDGVCATDCDACDPLNGCSE